MQASVAKGSEHTTAREQGCWATAQSSALYRQKDQSTRQTRAETSDLTELIFQCGDADKK